MLALVAACLLSGAGPPAQIKLYEGILAGPFPKDQAAVRALHEAGVRTVVSVDALPAPEPPDGLPMHRVHLPVGYDGIDAATLEGLLVVWRDLPRPIYVHCHHGRHRGPAAAVTMLRRLGLVDAVEGASLLKRCGTSPAYEGLYKSVDETKPIDAKSLAKVRRTLTAQARVGAMATQMAKLDRVWVQVQRSLDERADAASLEQLPERTGALTDHLRVCATRSRRMVPAFEEAIALASRLEAAVAAGDPGTARTHAAALKASCTACHRAWRDGVSSASTRTAR